MLEELFFFIASIAVIMFLLAVITKNFTISLVSTLFSFASSYGAMAIEIHNFFYDQNTGHVIENIKYVQSIPVAALFLLLGITSVIYAFMLPFEAAAGGENKLKV